MTTYSQTCTHAAVINSDSTLATLIHLGRVYLQKLQLRHSIRAERKQLLTMSSTMLSDIGIDRSEAQLEAVRTDVPASRIKFQDITGS